MDIPDPVDEALAALDARINALLPPAYRGCYAGVAPTSMGSAGVRYGPDGRVRWDDIWTDFCDLALAGGPPHRGTLLGPAALEEVAARPAEYAAVVEEIARGVWLAAGLRVLPRHAPGWVGAVCPAGPMAAWLHRAVVAENVTARREGQVLCLPAGPDFRVEKEVKNVVAAVAKTCHYWTDHASGAERGAAGVGAYVEPATPGEASAPADALAVEVARLTGLSADAGRYPAWVGVGCGDQDAAAWLMRAVLVEDVLVRREGDTVYLPMPARSAGDAAAGKVVAAFAGAWRLWRAHRAR